MNNIPFNSDEVCTNECYVDKLSFRHMEKQHQLLYFDKLWLSQEGDGKLQYHHKSQDIKNCLHKTLAVQICMAHDYFMASQA